MLEYLEPFNCMQTIIVLVSNKLTLIHLKIRLLTNLLIYKSYNYLTLCKKMSSGLFKNVIYKLLIYKSYIYIYIERERERENLALNNLQWLICHKIQPKNNKSTTLHCSVLSITFVGSCYLSLLLNSISNFININMCNKKYLKQIYKQNSIFLIAILWFITKIIVE